MTNIDATSFITEKASKNAVFSYNVNQYYIIITKDKLQLILKEHKDIMEISKSWIGYLFAVVAYTASIIIFYLQLDNEFYSKYDIKHIVLLFGFFIAVDITMFIFCAKDFKTYWKNRNKGIDFVFEKIKEAEEEYKPSASELLGRIP